MYESLFEISKIIIKKFVSFFKFDIKDLNISFSDTIQKSNFILKLFISDILM